MVESPEKKHNLDEMLQIIDELVGKHTLYVFV